MAEQTQIWAEACQNNTKHELCFGSDCFKTSIEETQLLKERINTICNNKQETSIVREMIATEEHKKFDRNSTPFKFYCVICGKAIEHPKVGRRLCRDIICKKIYSSAYHKILRQNPEERIRELERNRAWRKRPEVIVIQKEYKKAYYKKNRKKFLAYQKKWCGKNRERLKAYAKKRYWEMKNA